jgi:hypothetical protein
MHRGCFATRSWQPLSSKFLARKWSTKGSFKSFDECLAVKKKGEQWPMASNG